MMAPYGLLMLLALGGPELIFSQFFFGMPPKDFTPQLRQAAPVDAVFYSEWAESGEGEAGAPGLRGLLADPEVKAFASKVYGELTRVAEEKSDGGEESVFAEHLGPALLGISRRPGSAWLAYDPLTGADFAEQRGGPEGLVLGFIGGIAVDCGDEIEAVLEHVEPLVEAIPGAGDIGDVTGYVFETDFGEDSPPLVLRRHENYLILAFGDGAADDAIAGLRGDRPGLESTEELKAAFAQVNVAEPGRRVWMNTAGILRLVGEIEQFGPQAAGIAQLIGLDKVRSLSSVTGLQDGFVASESFLDTSGAVDGVLKLAAGPQLTPTDFEHIPAETAVVAAISLDFESVYAELRKVLENADPATLEALDADIAVVEEELGLTIDDLLGTIGSTWCIFDHPVGTSLPGTGLIASVSIDDPKKAEALFPKLMTLIRATLPGEQGRSYRGRRGIFLENGEFLGRKIYFLNVVGDDNPFPIAFCRTETEFLFALSPQTLKSHLLWRSEDQPTLATTIAERVPRFGDREQIGVYHYKSDEVFATSYSVAEYFLNMTLAIALQPQEFKITPLDLPSRHALQKYIGQGRGTIVREADGLRFRSVDGLPFPGIGGLQFILSTGMFGLAF